MYKELFARHLKELRIEKGLRQIDLATIMTVSKTTICQWETSKQEPGIEDIIKLALFFRVSADYLLGLEDEDGHREVEEYEFSYEDKFQKFTHKEKQK